jgi:hypothetical protein
MKTLRLRLRQKLKVKWRARRFGHEHEARHATREWLMV